MTGPSTIAHHHELHALVRGLKDELVVERKAAEYGRMRLGPDFRKMVDEQKDRAERAEARLAEAERLLRRIPLQGLTSVLAIDASEFLSRSPPEGR